MFPMPGCSIGRQDSTKSRTSVTGGGGISGPRGFGGGGGAGAGGEMDEETKKNQNIINIVREGQISLLVSGRSTPMVSPSLPPFNIHTIQYLMVTCPPPLFLTIPLPPFPAPPFQPSFF